MGHDASAQTQKLQAANLKAFESWMSSNGKDLVPKNDEAVIYAGYDPAALRKTGKLLSGDSEITKMWQKIEEINADIEKLTGQKKYDLLTDVLERCKKTPKLLATQGPEIGSVAAGVPNMLVYAKLMGNEKYGYIDRGKINFLWDTLSGAYVANSKGEVTLLEGRTKDNKQVTIAFTKVRKELDTLWKRSDLPDATRKNAAQMIARLEKYYDGQLQMGEKIAKEATEVMRQARIALKGR